MKIEFKSVRERHVAYIIATGYDQIPQIFGELINYIIKNNINTTEQPYCTFFNNTLEVPPEELHYEIGIPVIGDASGEGIIKIKKMHEHLAVSTIYTGSYEQRKKIYHNLMEHAVKNGYLIAGPVTEIYINNRVKVPESELKVEVRFPVIKKWNH